MNSSFIFEVRSALSAEVNSKTRKRLKGEGKSTGRVLAWSEPSKNREIRSGHPIGTHPCARNPRQSAGSLRVLLRERVHPFECNWVCARYVCMYIFAISTYRSSRFDHGRSNVKDKVQPGVTDLAHGAITQQATTAIGPLRNRWFLSLQPSPGLGVFVDVCGQGKGVSLSQACLVGLCAFWCLRVHSAANSDMP